MGFEFAIVSKRWRHRVVPYSSMQTAKWAAWKKNEKVLDKRCHPCYHVKVANDATTAATLKLVSDIKK